MDQRFYPEIDPNLRRRIAVPTFQWEMGESIGERSVHIRMIIKIQTDQGRAVGLIEEFVDLASDIFSQVVKGRTGGRYS